MIDAKKIIDILKSKHGGSVVSATLDAIDPSVEVTAESLLDVCRTLRDDPELSMNYLSMVSGLDYCEPDPAKAAKAGFEPHVEVLYHLSSIPGKQRIVVRVKLPRWAGDKEGELPELDSVAEIWPTADWHEREVYDLMGVRFRGHTDLRRILCPEDWPGHPLRKDYVTPTEYQGIPVK